MAIILEAPPTDSIMTAATLELVYPNTRTRTETGHLSVLGTPNPYWQGSFTFSPASKGEASYALHAWIARLRGGRRSFRAPVTAGRPNLGDLAGLVGLETVIGSSRIDENGDLLLYMRQDEYRLVVGFFDKDVITVQNQAQHLLFHYDLVPDTGVDVSVALDKSGQATLTRIVTTALFHDTTDAGVGAVHQDGTDFVRVVIVGDGIDLAYAQSLIGKALRIATTAAQRSALHGLGTYAFFHVTGVLSVGDDEATLGGHYGEPERSLSFLIPWTHTTPYRVAFSEVETAHIDITFADVSGQPAFHEANAIFTSLDDQTQIVLALPTTAIGGDVLRIDANDDVRAFAEWLAAHRTDTIRVAIDTKPDLSGTLLKAGSVIQVGDTVRMVVKDWTGATDPLTVEPAQPAIEPDTPFSADDVTVVAVVDSDSIVMRWDQALAGGFTLSWQEKG